MPPKLIGALYVQAIWCGTREPPLSCLHCFLMKELNCWQLWQWSVKWKRYESMISALPQCTQFIKFSSVRVNCNNKYVTSKINCSYYLFASSILYTIMLLHTNLSCTHLALVWAMFQNNLNMHGDWYHDKALHIIVLWRSITVLKPIDFTACCC